MTETTLGALPASTQIQEAGWRDFNAVRRLEQLCFPLDAWPWWDMVSVLSMPNIVRLKAVVGDELVGFVVGDVRKLQERAWVATICVDPEFQGQGIGNQLMDAVENQVGVTRMRLSVRKSNHAAISLYESRGYQQVGEWPRYYRGGEDALIMEKELPDKGYE